MEHETGILLAEHQQDHQYPPETPNENPSVSVPVAIPVASWSIEESRNANDNQIGTSIANDESFRSPEEGIRYPDNKRAMAKEAGGSKTVFGVRTFPDSFHIQNPAGSIWLEAQEAAKANKSGGSVRVFQSADNIVDNIADAEAWIKSQDAAAAAANATATAAATATATANYVVVVKRIRPTPPSRVFKVVIRVRPAYPGYVLTGRVYSGLTYRRKLYARHVYAGEAHAFVPPKKTVQYVHTDGRTYNIFFYQLADGRGWIHDFQRRDPGIRTLEVMSTAQAQLERASTAQARHQEAYSKRCCKHCVFCKHCGVGVLGLVLGGLSAIMLVASFFTSINSDYRAAPTLGLLTAHFGLGVLAISILAIHRCHTKKRKKCQDTCGRGCAWLSIVLWIIALPFAYLFAYGVGGWIVIPPVGVLAGIAGLLQIC